MGSIIHESVFDNDVSESLDDEDYTYYDNHNGRVGWMSKEYQTKVRTKNRNKNKTARNSRKKNRRN